MDDSTKESEPAKDASRGTTNLLVRLDEDLAELSSIPKKLNAADSTKKTSEVFNDVLSEIVRRRRAFDSKTFFMVTFGMLKAGKSTLVNTFVGKEVSPVGRAKETTLRSSIVLAADEENREGIYLYSPKECASSNEEEALFEWQRKNGTSLMDFLNGLTTREEFLGSFKEDVLPFSESELETLLTSPVVPEYPNILPPVIRIDASRTDSAVGAANLLKDGVAIFDTPGLDGAKANKDSDPFWKSLTTCGDYYLLVQSSMSAINKDCLQLISDIFRETKNAPLLVVFNEIAANFWQLPDVEKMKLRADSETASGELAEQLRTKMGGTLPESVSINAGEASDAVFGPSEEMQKDPEEMIVESRVRELRDRIVKTLREERTAIKVRNATDRMLKALKESIETIETAKGALEAAEKEEADKETKRWAKDQADSDDLSNAFEDNGAGVRIASEFGNQLMATLKGNKYPNPNNPYHEFKGFSKNRKDNCDYQSGADVETKLGKLLQEFKTSFLEAANEQFTGSNLRVGKDPWPKVRDRVTNELDQLKAFPRGAGFPESLFQSFDVDEILSFLEQDGFMPEIPAVPRVPWAPWRDRTYGTDSVWECDCARKFDELKDAISNIIPGKAAKEAGNAFRDAIVRKGKNHATKVAKDVKNMLDEQRNLSEKRKEAVRRQQKLLSDAVQRMENMKRILEEG